MLGRDQATATAQAVSKGFVAADKASDNESIATVNPALDAHIGENDGETYEVSTIFYVSGILTVEARTTTPRPTLPPRASPRSGCRGWA